MLSALFFDTTSVKAAIELAEANPGQIQRNQDLFVVGRLARMNVGTVVQNDVEIRCKTFLSLGEIELNSLKIFAETIIFVNKLYTTGETTFNCRTFVSIGCTIAGPGKMTVNALEKIHYARAIIHHSIETEVTTATIQVGDDIQEISFTKTTEYHEDPIDASLRALAEQLALSECLNRYDVTTPFTAQLGRTSVLVDHNL